MKTLACAITVVLLTTLSGCAALVTPPPALTTYDLGEVFIATPGATRIVPDSVEVRAPSWLSSTAMQYRLDYVTPASREVFTQSRWAGYPSEMLQRLLSSTLVSSAARSGGCRLSVDLDEFVQRFASPAQSQSALAARVSLIAPRDNLTLARQTFVVAVDAPTADARGGVVAHRLAARTLAGDIGTWLDTLDAKPGQGSHAGDYIRQRCKG